MDNLLLSFVDNTSDAKRNFDLGVWYEHHGYTAAGLTFFLRAAEYSIDDDLTYEALIRGFYCYKNQGSRDDSAQILLQNAVATFPKRPEAYFLLSRFYEQYQKWQESYIYACLGLELTEDNQKPLLTDAQYPGKYGLMFQKAVSGYHWGKEQECRKLFQDLINNYHLDEPYKTRVINSIQTLGPGSKETVFREYTNDLYDKLKFKFDGCDRIKNNFSQAYQDMFTMFINQGKINGKYVEIGSGDPKWFNNTYLLETQFNWRGIGIDSNEELVRSYNSSRKNQAICANAHDLDYYKLLETIFGEDTEIDYLQLDCEPPESTYNLLLKLPFDKYKFKVITFEHDYYADIEKKYRQLSRDFLINQGYELVISNVSSTDWSAFEDWWVCPDLVDQSVVAKIKNDNNSVKKIDDYFLDKNISKIPKNIFTFSDIKKTSIIVDNFYDHPHNVREFALAQDFIEGGFGKGFIGKRTRQQYLFDGLKEKFEKILGCRINSWYDEAMNGRFQITFAGDPLVYHCDTQKWAAMIYLTPNAPFECGTTLYAHKLTKARSYYDDGWNYSWKDDPALGDLHLDGTFFEPVDVFGNVFNRLIIFDGSNIHAASKYFGQINSNARLWHMFFFD